MARGTIPAPACTMLIMSQVEADVTWYHIDIVALLSHQTCYLKVNTLSVGSMKPEPRVGMLVGMKRPAKSRHRVPGACPNFVFTRPAGYRNWPEFGPRMPDAVTAFDAVGRRGASAGAERKLKQRAGARHQVDLAVTLQSPSEKAASTASGGGGAGNPPGLAQAKNLLVHFQRLWA